MSRYDPDLCERHGEELVECLDGTYRLAHTVRGVHGRITKHWMLGVAGPSATPEEVRRVNAGSDAFYAPLRVPQEAASPHGRPS